MASQKLRQKNLNTCLKKAQIEKTENGSKVTLSRKTYEDLMSYLVSQECERVMKQSTHSSLIDGGSGNPRTQLASAPADKKNRGKFMESSHETHDSGT